MSSTAAPDVRFKGRATATEWPTVVLGVVILGCYAAITLGHRRLGAAGTIVLLAVVSGWWSSFQHELIHGHPFRSQAANDLVGGLSLNLWIPYRVFKATHLRHHRDALLTDPIEDPESMYCTSMQWRDANPIVRALMWTNRTFAGRMVIGPLVTMARFLGGEARRLASGEKGVHRDWGSHLVGAALTSTWVFGVARVPVWQYAIGAIWFGMSVFLIRSFAEHRWLPEGQSRSAFVEGVFPFGLLFLFNNYHHAHHARPNVPWYQYPALARHLDSRAAAKAGAGYYRGYREVVAQYLFRPFCVPVHPPTDEGQALLRERGVIPVAASS